jgi:hypothetical protein
MNRGFIAVRPNSRALARFSIERKPGSLRKLAQASAGNLVISVTAAKTAFTVLAQ